MKLNSKNRALKLNLFQKIKWQFLLILVLCGIYEVNSHGYKGGLTEFVNHFFPDLVAAYVVYMLVDRGIKILIGVSEERYRNYKKIKRYFQNAKFSIDILDTYVIEIVNRIGVAEFKTLLINALQRNVDVKILILNPDSDACKQRIQDLVSSETFLKKEKLTPKEKEEKLRRDIKNSIVFLFRMYLKIYSRSENNTDSLLGKSSKLEIKLYDRTPSMSYYSWDNSAYFSLISPKGLTDDNPNLLISKYSIFGRYLSEVFDDMFYPSQWDKNSENQIKSTTSILEYMIMSVDLNEHTSLGKIEELKNMIFMGFPNTNEEGQPIHGLRGNPKFITSRNFQHFLKDSHSQNKKILVFYHGRKVQLEIVEIIEASHPSYKDIRKLVDKFYEGDKMPEKFYIHKSSTIFKINFC